MLNETQRSHLLHIARESIAAVLTGRPLPRPDPETLDAELKRPSGVFVTLNDRQGELRGCIGSIQPIAPLHEAVASSAVNAAFRDPRFPPVSPEELDSLHLEISVMTPIVPVENVEEIEVGRDGLIVSRGPRAGLLLPQVASEYGWDRETFLRQTCHKAGLPSDAWRQPGTTIEKFSAEVFGE
jgi:AmmeMemoRadiSam system protein A